MLKYEAETYTVSWYRSKKFLKFWNGVRNKEVRRKVVLQAVMFEIVD